MLFLRTRPRSCALAALAAWLTMSCLSGPARAQDGRVPQPNDDSPVGEAVAADDTSPDDPDDWSAAPRNGASGAPTSAWDARGEGRSAIPPEQPLPASAAGSANAMSVVAPPAETPEPESPLEPTPDPLYAEKVAVETASFNRVTPGVTTLEEIEKAWGPPREMAHRNAQLVHLYVIEPFSWVEVSFLKDKVAAIVIRLDQAFPAKTVAEQLEMGNIQPVLVSNELGEVLGQSFPERGVLFSFEPSDTPGKASMRVHQIIIEPVSSESFVLRAETFMERRLEASLRDLAEAVKLDPNHARAHWLRARLLTAVGDVQAALEASSEAVRLEPRNPQYRMTRARVLGRLNRVDEGIEQAEQALADSESRPHVKAEIFGLLGDLHGSGKKPDYRRALDYHMNAIRTADPLAASRHPALRLAAKEVLVNAHLGAAHDIAWGLWEQKEQSVPRWIERAEAAAADLVQNEGGSAEHELQVAVRALAACVGLRDQVDPTPWVDKTLETTRRLLDEAGDSRRKRQLQWEAGTALYDAVQIYQMRGEHETALRCGGQAVEYLEAAAESHTNDASETYLLGRLYFRLGAIHAVGKQDHAAAVTWFEKGIPLFEETVPQLGEAEFGRLGETYVSMGVSYWEEGQKDRAVRLTKRGAELMHQAVIVGALAEPSLEIPYSNLATMAQHLGQNDQARQYLEEARRYKQSAPR